MIFRKLLSVLIVCSFFLLAAPSQTAFPDLLRLVPLTSVVFAQDLSKTVLPITEFKLKLKLKPKKSFPSSVDLAGLKPKITLSEEADFGTGFCLDPECRLIGTNYHVAMMARPRKIKGAEVMERYLATGPDDEGATLNDIFSVSPMKIYPQPGPRHLRVAPPPVPLSRHYFQSQRSSNWAAGRHLRLS